MATSASVIGGEMMDEAPADGVTLERDLILSDIRLEGALLALRENPRGALSALTLSGERPPFDPAGLRYDESVAARLRGRRAAGETPPILSDLPAGWRAAILAHLGLAGDDAGPRAAAEPAARIGLVRAWAKALRLHQWAKNALVFVPLLMAHRFLEAGPMVNAALAFLAFGLAASCIYLMNDLMDLRQDRAHPSKRRRPFASGAITVREGLLAIPLLAGLAAVVAAQLPPMFAAVLLAYAFLNLAYTFYLKRKLLVDVLALAGCYVLRILAGNAAGPIEISNWLLAFALFLFFSLALVKRYVELDTVDAEAPDSKRFMGRGYRKDDLDMLAQLGVASGFAAIVVLALFVEGAGKTGLYANREVIWLIVPIVLYVIARIWVLAKRRELPDDPVYFILTDWRSHLMGAIIALVFWLAK